MLQVYIGDLIAPLYFLMLSFYDVPVIAVVLSIGANSSSSVRKGSQDVCSSATFGTGDSRMEVHLFLLQWAYSFPIVPHGGGILRILNYEYYTYDLQINVNIG